MTDFVSVATIDEIRPGDRLTVGIGRDWVLLINIDGEIFAIQDACPHDDGPLSEGNVEGCVIECPRHGAKFDLRTGKVLAAPALVDVPAYDVRVEGGEVKIARRKRPT